MDKTMQERAEKSANEATNRKMSNIWVAHRNGYIQGATEQKKLDDDHLREVRKMVIDKSCEWLKQQGKEWWEGYGIPFSIEDYRKAMMEG